MTIWVVPPPLPKSCIILLWPYETMRRVPSLLWTTNVYLASIPHIPIGCGKYLIYFPKCSLFSVWILFVKKLEIAFFRKNSSTNTCRVTPGNQEEKEITGCENTVPVARRWLSGYWTTIFSRNLLAQKKLVCCGLVFRFVGKRKIYSHWILLWYPVFNKTTTWFFFTFCFLTD